MRKSNATFYVAAALAIAGTGAGQAAALWNRPVMAQEAVEEAETAEEEAAEELVVKEEEISDAEETDETEEMAAARMPADTAAERAEEADEAEEAGEEEEINMTEETGGEEEINMTEEAGGEEEINMTEEAGGEKEINMAAESGPAEESGYAEEPGPAERAEEETEEGTEEETGEGTEEETEEETGEGTEAETEEGTEEQEKQTCILHVTGITVEPESRSRVYDGTDRVRLNYEVTGELLQTEEGRPDAQYSPLPEGTDLGVSCECRLTGSDVGEWEVQYEFFPVGSSINKYHTELDVEMPEAPLTAVITPAPLQITLPSVWRLYGLESKPENLHLTDNLSVSGFVRGEDGKEIIPDDFVLPDFQVSSNAPDRWSPIYEKGKNRIYEKALVLRRNDDGAVSGCPGRNYYFDETLTAGGNLVIAPGAVLLGTDYRIIGDEGKYCQGTDGKWFVRVGSGLYAVPTEKSGYEAGTRLTGLEGSGEEMMVLTCMDDLGGITVSSQPFSVCYEADASVPAAAVTADGGREEAGVRYYSESAGIQITVPEDGQSGLAEAVYSVYRNGNMEMTGECADGSRLSLADEGEYRVAVQTRDRVGNEAATVLEGIVVDRTDPFIQISGIEEDSANTGSVQMTVTCSDANYRPGSLRAVLEGGPEGTKEYTGGHTGGQGDGFSGDFSGDTLQIGDIPHTRENDAVYTLRVEAEDKAGNRTEKSLVFSANRFGSAYSISQETLQELERFYHQKPFPVTFVEKNIDEVGSADIAVYRNGKFSAGAGESMHSQKSGERGNLTYTYCIPAESFQEEGIYDVLLMTTDAAGNSTDSVSQKQGVRFAVDTTGPECLMTGIENGSVYAADEVWLNAQVRDNFMLKEIRVYVDGELAKTLDSGELSAGDGLVREKFTRKDAWQSIQLCALDEAGNRSWTEERVFYVAGDGAAAGQVPPYEKQRKTARELEEGKDPDSSSPAALKAGVGGVPGEDIFAAGEDGEGSRPAGKRRKLLGSVSALFSLLSLAGVIRLKHR